MSRRVAIVQSNYIPWKGYFDLIAAVDEFVLFDEVQYTRRDWRNRNRIKTAHGPQWLTVPVAVKGHYLAPIREIALSDPDWTAAHWRKVAASYARAARFSDVAPRLEELYLTCTYPQLSDVNRHFLSAICAFLRIETPMRWSWEYPPSETARMSPSRRLAEICSQAGATTYLSGPSAKVYLEESAFVEQGIAVEYFDYSGYTEYPQLYPPFDHRVSIVDLLCNTGSDARGYLLAARR